MEAIAISAPVASPAVQTAVQTQAAEGQVSFAQLLSGMAGTTYSGTQAETSSSGTGLSWREMQTVSQMMMGGLQQLDVDADTGAGLSIESLLAQLMNILGNISEKDVTDALTDEEDPDGVFAKIEKIHRQMEQMMALAGQAGENQQMMMLLAQVYELPLTPEIGEDGTIALTLPQSDVLAQQLMDSDPAELLSKLTGLPAETIQKVLDGQQGTAQTAVQPQAEGFAGEMPVTEMATVKTGVQDGELAFQNNVQAARQQLEAAPAKAETELDVDELQRQVDEGVHFKNTGYATAVQAEAKAEQATAPPVLTQMQDGIIKGIQQGEEQFTIKLLPEGLGEVEVRLTKTAEGMLLNLVTKNAETQRVLTAEIDALRDQMRAFKVDVDSILTQQQDDFLNRQRSFEQQAWQSRQNSAGSRRQSAANDEPDVVELQAAPRQLSGALDTYI